VSPELAQTHLAAKVGLTAGTLVLDGRFRVEKLLGGGGMGLVYLAEQVSLGRKVALKVLREDLPLTANVGERFRREALLLSSVEHPGVVRVIDFGHHGASACLVMELVEGDSLETVLQREAPMSVERTEAIVLQLAHGLSAIHERGIVHRDLKPDNVTLSKSTQGVETARLLDFGIARLAGGDGVPHADRRTPLQRPVTLRVRQPAHSRRAARLAGGGPSSRGVSPAGGVGRRHAGQEARGPAPDRA